MDEIYSESNFVATIIIKKNDITSSRIKISHEYVHIYSSDRSLIKVNKLIDEKKKVGQQSLMPLDVAGIRHSETLIYEIYDNDGNRYIPGVTSNGIQKMWRWSREKVKNDFDKLEFIDGRIYEKVISDGKSWPTTLVLENFNDNEENNFEKTIKLIKHLISIFSNKDTIILEPFNSTGAIGQAITELNIEDNGSRRFIIGWNNTISQKNNNPYEYLSKNIIPNSDNFNEKVNVYEIKNINVEIDNEIKDETKIEFSNAINKIAEREVIQPSDENIFYKFNTLFSKNTVNNNDIDKKNIKKYEDYDEIFSSDLLELDQKKKIIEIMNLVKENSDDEKFTMNLFKLLIRRIKTGFVFDESPQLIDKDKLFLLNESLELKTLNENAKNENSLIIGENYNVLRNLLFSHQEKVDIIYIDPPYNTEASANQTNDSINKGTSSKFVYNDKFSRAGWLNFINDRLLLAKELLSDDGVILISIDDNEQPYLKVLLDEIFGEKNFICTFIWRKKNVEMNPNRIGTLHEYIHVYSKNRELINVNNIKDESKKYVMPSTLLIKNVPSNSTTGKEFFDIFGKKIFSYPKPTKLIKHLLSIFSRKDSIILDFFAGSGTTGHAVMELNREDGGNRKFILNTLGKDESTTIDIAKEIAYERLKRIMTGQASDKSKFKWIDNNEPYSNEKLNVYEIEEINVDFNNEISSEVKKRFASAINKIADKKIIDSNDEEIFHKFNTLFTKK